MVSPSFSLPGRQLRSEPMGWRVEDDGASEGHAVIARIGRTLPRETGLTSIWSCSTRDLDEPTQEAKQMMTAHPVGAASRSTLNWQAINWPKVHRTVRRLQARIVQATQACRWNKVKALQHLLTHSFSGKALAVKRVTDNQGKRTAGVDGVTWTSPQDKTQAVHSLRRRGYRASPLRRVSIPKSNGKRRLLGIPMYPSYCTSCK